MQVGVTRGSGHSLLRRDDCGRVRWLVHDRVFRMCGGEVHNSSGSSLPYLATAIERARLLGVNALIIPLSWELVEPQEGEFDWTLVDGILELMRQADLKWIPQWFGAVKNTNAAYAPAWVKLDGQRFPRVRDACGRATNMLSVVSPALLIANCTAVGKAMARLAQRDHAGTVIAFQPENEVGLLGQTRDYSAAAVTAFAQEIPPEIGALLQGEGAATLRPEVREPWIAAGKRCAGIWPEVFGAAADEVFMAWSYGRFVGQLAAVAVAAYHVPVLANAWIVQHAHERAGQYPSGGPIAGMIDVWRAAAPAIDIYACDIYLDDFAGVCADYHQRGNSLLIPEARRDERMAVKCWYAFGQHDCLGFAPFGIESVGLGSAPPIDGAVALGTATYESSAVGAALLAKTYRLLGAMLPAIEPWLGSARAVGILQRSAQPQYIELGGYRFIVEWLLPHDPMNPGCGGLMVSPRDGEFIVAGMNLRIAIHTLTGAGTADFLSLDEGDYHAGQWLAGRRLNGDEAWLRLGGEPGVRHCHLYSYS